MNATRIEGEHSILPNRSRRFLKRFVVPGAVLAMCLMHTTAWADSFVPDQSNMALFFPSLVQNIQLFAPIGQEFTPTQPTLNVVQLRTQDFVPNDGTGASLFVNIRAGTILGSVVGTSQIVMLPDSFGTAGGALTEFDFSSNVPLVPGNVFVIELVHASGDMWGVGSCGGLCGNTYPPGRQILLGAPVPDNDLWFAEGTAVPEPSTWLLVASGVLGIGFAKKYVRA
jgi:hypothetical protein